MTAKDIEARLIVDLYRRSFVIPRYKPAGWWECDLFEITAAGYWREYEIKISRADFKADALKEHPRSIWRSDFTLSGPQATQGKHARLNSRDKKGPSRFSFVVPDGLITEADVPDWAGLIYARPLNGRTRPWSCSLDIIRKPPQLHKEGAEHLREHAKSVCYYRMNNLYMRQELDFAGSIVLGDPSVVPLVDADTVNVP